MDWVLLIGRILFALIFVMSGAKVHLIQRAQGVQYARANQVPVPELLVPLSGLMAVVGGAFVALGLWADLGALLLAAFAFPVGLGMHAFWKLPDPMERANQQAHFMKNLSIGGAALALFVFFQQFGDELDLVIEPTLF
ncbi:MAG: DoxX family protein [Gaiellaceae bacterium]